MGGRAGAGTITGLPSGLERPRFHNNGADVEGKTRDVIARIPKFTTARRRADGIFAATDMRWAAVSTGLTAVVAGAIAWMAVGTMPVTRPMVSPGRSALPYALFAKLIWASEPQNALDANTTPTMPTPTPAWKAAL